MLWLAFIVLVASFPIGYVLKALTKEEMGIGKKYFKYLWFLTLGLSVFFLFTNLDDQNTKLSIIFTLLFIANVAFISWGAKK